MPIREGTRLTEERFEQLEQRFGAAALEVREGAEGRELRLATLAELRARFERPGEFTLLTGEEITDRFEGQPLHVNGVHLVETIAPRGGSTLRETLNADVEAVLEQARRLGRPMLAHVNHPNFGWALTWEDLAHVRGDRCFEVYNGHSAVRNEGDAEHPSTERMWDLANALRLTELDLPLLFGLATDDGHDYYEQGPGRSNPGRGWIAVRSAALDGESIVRAVRRGDFYASSGVALRDVRVGGGRYVVEVEPRPGVGHTTTFYGARLIDGRPTEIGQPLAETTENPASYEFRGDELFVRAVVTSTQPHPNPYRAGDLEQAWTQPARPE